MSRAANIRQAALARTRAQWNDRAVWWDDMSERNAITADRHADLLRITAALRLTSGDHVLDAGCGSGQFAIAFAKLGCQVTGIDLAPMMLDLARSHATDHDVVAEFREGDLAHINDPDHTYDAVFARVALQFVTDLPAALREIRRVLRPGGRLLASVPGALSPIRANRWRRLLEPDTLDGNWALPWELASLLTELGWTIHDGWGEYGPSLDGSQNTLTPQEIATLPLPLQQAAATAWTIIAD